MKKRSLVCGVGFTDLPASVTILGKSVIYKAYSAWSAMLYRCYSESIQKKWPTYRGVKVCDEWHVYSAFKSWYDLNYVEGFYLDKDALSGGAKVYSPSTCVYIPQEVNMLMVVPKSSRGDCPLGVEKSATPQ